MTVSNSIKVGGGVSRHGQPAKVITNWPKYECGYKILLMKWIKRGLVFLTPVESLL